VAVTILWGFVIICGLLGLIGLLWPSGMRGIIKMFLANTPWRVFGILLMVAGGFLFRTAAQQDLALVVKIASVVLFMVGGVELLLPSFLVIFNEWWLTKSDMHQRLAGALWLILAALFFVGTRLATVVEEVITESSGLGN